MVVETSVASAAAPEELSRRRRVGVLLMLATPAVRVLVACVLFFREKDKKYGWISVGVLVILLLGGVFGIGEH